MANPHELYQEADGANPSPVPRTSPISAIGQVLESPELLRAILDILEPGRYSDNDTDEELVLRTANKATLAACARVSHHFSQHALDVLWSALDSPCGALLYILPSIQSVDAGPERGYYKTMITGDISPAEWARFCEYTARVREISHEGTAIDPLVWTILARKCRGEPLFPRLRLIVAWGFYEDDVPALVSFLSPSLRHFTLEIGSPKDLRRALQLCASLKVLFQTLVDIARNLTALIWEAPFDWRFGSGFLARIGRLRTLQTLKLSQYSSHWYTPPVTLLRPSPQIPAAEPTLLRELTAIPPLRYLHLDMGLIELDQEMKDVAGLAFEQLLTLRMIGGPAEALATLVHSLSLPALESLVVDLNHDHPVALSAFKDLLVKLCADLPHKLQDFEWRRRGNLIPGSSTVDMEGQAFAVSCVLAPLLRFTNLCHVQVQLCTTSSLHITDNDVAQLAAAWPNIQTLCISTEASPDSETVLGNDIHPTIAALVTFAQRCPMLYSLSLPSLDFSSVFLDTAVVPLIPRHPLRRLFISRTVCGLASATEAVILLKRLFPALEYLSVSAHLSGAGDPGAERAFATQIGKLVSMLRRVRDDERMRAKSLAGGEGQMGCQ